MEKLFIKIALICILVFGTFVYIFPWNTVGISNIPFSGGEYKLGLDLRGGVELDYKVELSEVEKEDDYNKQKEDSIIEGLKSIIDKRIQSLNITDSIISSSNYAGERHIIVQIPLKGENPQEDSENIKKAKETIGKVVKIEFRELRKDLTQEDIVERKSLANKISEELKSSEYDFFVTANKYRDIEENIEVGTLSGTLDELFPYFSFSENPSKGLISEVISGTGGFMTFSPNEGYYILNIKSIEDKEVEKTDVEDISNSEESTLTGVDITSYTGDEISTSISDTNTGISSGTGELEIAELDTGDTDEKEIEMTKLITFDYIFVDARPSDWIPAQDSQGRILNDKYFVRSSVQYNDAFQPMIELTFNNEGAQIFGELTSRLIGERIAIFVGGELITDPNVIEKILDGKAVITGDYTPEEANKLSNDINTGVIPAPIYLTSENSIDAKLGANSLEGLIIAGLIGFSVIFIFLVLAYRLSGLVAGISLAMYVILVLGVIKGLGITLTLASVAGLILSIGIAIDANILIFERIKDELRRGIPIKKAVIIGFDKSWSAIWDSNLTGLIVAIILFIFGINMIKGFGLMLGIGIIVSLFSAMWISRLFIFALASKRDEDKKLKCFIGFKSDKS